MKFQTLEQSDIHKWEEAEQGFLGSLVLSHLPKERFAAAKQLINQAYPGFGSGKLRSNFLFNTSVVTQIPFTSYMIVDVRPYSSPAEFERYYGLSVDEFVRLMREGFLFPNFGSDMRRYVGHSFMLPIFNACELPPSNMRTDRVFALLDREYDETCRRLYRDLTPSLDRIWSESEEDLRAYYMHDADAFRTTWSKRTARVGAISPVWGRILAGYSRRRDFLTLVNIFTSVLVFPITKALGGVYKMSFSNYKSLCSALGATQVKHKQVMPFSKEIAEPLCDAITATLPQKMDIKRMIPYLNDELVVRANELMQELEEGISKKESAGKSRALALREVWSETAKMITLNERRRVAVRKVLNISLAGLVGATLWSKLDFTAILYGVVAREVLKKEGDGLTETIAHDVVKMMSKQFQPSQVWMFSDYLESLKKAVPKVYLS